MADRERIGERRPSKNKRSHGRYDCKDRHGHRCSSLVSNVERARERDEEVDEEGGRERRGDETLC
jgi:hypothetical protein